VVKDNKSAQHQLYYCAQECVGKVKIDEKTNNEAKRSKTKNNQENAYGTKTSLT